MKFFEFDKDLVKSNIIYILFNIICVDCLYLDLWCLFVFEYRFWIIILINFKFFSNEYVYINFYFV